MQEIYILPDLMMLCFCQSLFTLDHCIGIIGGRPRHSLYFVGFQGMKAILRCFFGHPLVTCLHTCANTVPAVYLDSSLDLLQVHLCLILCFFHLLNEARGHTLSSKVASVSAVMKPIGQKTIIGEDF